MAYIILTSNGRELDRHELKGASTIGRAADCDIRVHDILLSRHHCRIEPFGDAWRITDIQSKNGTYLGWQRIRQQILTNNDDLRVGRTLIKFLSGPFEPSAETQTKPRTVRPADPFEALSGTVAGYVYQPQPEFQLEQDDDLTEESASPELVALTIAADRVVDDGFSSPALPSQSVRVAPASQDVAVQPRTARRVMPVPKPYSDEQARRAAYLNRLEDVSLQVTTPPSTASGAIQLLPSSETDWKLVAMLLSACVVTLAIAFVLKP